MNDNEASWPCTARRARLTALVDEVRSACARVAERAEHVRVVEAAIEHYARTLPPESPPAPDLEGGSLEERAAFSLTLNAINFGSGWFPTLRKPNGLSGFRTVEAGLRARGPWTAAELASIETPEVAATFGQDPAHELMALFTRALRELGERITVEYFGRFLGLVNSADGLGGAAGRDARDVADLARRLRLRRRAGAVLQARADRRRRPPPGRASRPPRTSTA